MDSTLQFVIGKDAGPPSFNPLDSDGLLNAIHLEQVLGTLVRMSPHGRYEGYLASGWTIEDSGKKWSFKIRPGLTCEDGTPINAKTYADSLVKSIRLVSRNSELPLINQLVGFDEFKSGKSAALGILAQTDSVLEFHFSSHMHSGFLEYAGLPILGFYCSSNFNADGSWKDDKHIVSSAAYKLGVWDGLGPVTLVHRTEWNLASDILLSGSSTSQTNKAPGKVIISRGKLTADTLKDKQHVAMSFDPAVDDHYASSMQSVRTVPTILHGLMISPMRSAQFKDKAFRTLIRTKVREHFKSSVEVRAGSELVSTLYPHLSSITTGTDLPATAFANGFTSTGFDQAKPVKILVSNSLSATGHQILQATKSALQNLKITFEVSEVDNSQNLMTVWRNQNEWDLKIFNVDIGGGIENQLIKFMFCSKLGVSFPDPSGRICNLVQKHDETQGDLLDSRTLKSYINDLDKIIDEDAALIPLMKSGHAWYISNDVDPSFISPSMGIPYFDLVRFK